MRERRGSGARLHLDVMGGDGGPMSFLGKKSWHVGSLKMQERVWKKEEEAAQEKKRTEEMKKHIQEERERSELRQYAKGKPSK